MYSNMIIADVRAVYYRLKTRNLDEMGGLGHSMKYTAIFFIIGALAIAGIPPLNGFASKLIIYESAYKVSPILTIIAIVVSILTLAIFVKVFHSLFMGPKIHDVEEAPITMLIGMGILTFVVILFGLFPEWAVDSIVQPAAQALADQAAYIGAVLGG